MKKGIAREVLVVCVKGDTSRSAGCLISIIISLGCGVEMVLIFSAGEGGMILSPKNTFLNFGGDRQDYSMHYTGAITREVSELSVRTIMAHNITNRAYLVRFFNCNESVLKSPVG